MGYRIIKASSVCGQVKNVMASNINNSGKVHCIISKALYVKIDKKLLTLTAGQGNFPYGILIESEDLSAFKQVSNIDCVALHPMRMIFDKQNICVDMSDAITWTPSVLSCNVLKSEQIISKLKYLRKFLVGQDRMLSLIDLAQYINFHNNLNVFSDLRYKRLNIYCQVALPILVSIQEYLNLSLYEEAVISASKLVGLGPGLTPSGDDILIGLMSSIYGGLSLSPYMGSCLIQAFRESLAAESYKTTEVGQAFLDEALIGNFHEYLRDLTSALFYGNLADTIVCSNKLATVGASSGLDMILGAYFGGGLMLANELR